MRLHVTLMVNYFKAKIGKSLLFLSTILKHILLVDTIAKLIINYSLDRTFFGVPFCCKIKLITFLVFKKCFSDTITFSDIITVKIYEVCLKF